MRCAALQAKVPKIHSQQPLRLQRTTIQSQYDQGSSRGGGGEYGNRGSGGGGRGGGGSGGGRREYGDQQQRTGGRSYERRDGGYGGGNEDGQRRSGGGGGYRQGGERSGGSGYAGGGGGGGYRQQGGERSGGQRTGGPRGGLPGGDNRPQRFFSPESAALTETIRSAPNWRALQRILESAGGGGAELDPFQLVSMLWRATELPAPSAAEPDDLADYQGFVAGVYGWLLSKMDQAKPQQLARALRCVAKLGLYNAELVDALTARAQRELHNTYDDDLNMMMEAMAALGYQPGEAFGAQLLRRTQGRLSSMQPRALSGLLTALPRLGLAPTPEWFAAYADAALANLRQFRAGEFSALVVGLASSGWQPSGPAQLQPLVDRCFPLLTYELRVERPGGGAGGSRPASVQASVDEEGAAGAAAAAAAGGVQQASPPQRAGGWRNDFRTPKSVEPQVAIDWLVNVTWAMAQMVAGTGAQLPQQWGNAIFDKLQVTN